MKILSRYVLKHLLPVFALALLAFVGLYLIIDFFEKVDDLLEKQVPALQVAQYFLYKLPIVAMQGIPMSLLLATLIALGILKRNRELIALRAAGIHSFRYAGPIALAALVVAAIHFGVGELFARGLSQKSQSIWQEYVQHRRQALSWSQENVWFRGRNIIYQIRVHDRKLQTLEKVSLFFLDDKFRLTERLDARRLRWEHEGWIAEDGLILRFSGQDIHQEWFETRTLVLEETLEDFSSLATLPEELDWLDLYRYTQKIRREGYNAIPYEVELNLRTAAPVTTLILTLLGITLALRQGLHGGIAAGIGLALLAASVYMALTHLGSSLALAGILPPIIGVWSGNLIFGAVALYLWLRETGW
ncbi:MAG: LPS export ABC transporter permease LptG [Syntrophobacteraceae bacterium]|jgi:lipopolysaccharide export system permease protein|nr:LPS export ABC transporter permease LptG [Syntrophobacteraceae bacterium]